MIKRRAKLSPAEGEFQFEIDTEPLEECVMALKRLALPPELLAARPKRLRFLIFYTPGKLVQHARQTLLRLARGWARFSNWHHALGLLPLPARC
jgi:hypothetical protein